MKLTYNQAMILASGQYLTKSLPFEWLEWDDDEQNKFVEDNAWQPFENWDAKELFREISQLANIFLEVTGGEQ